MNMDLKQKTANFRALHEQEEVLFLPNCWDVISARTLSNCGFGAIATASASIAWSYGVGDGENLSREEMLSVISRICNSVDIPVSADIERGYGETPQDVAETVQGVITAGAVGFNIEDSGVPEGQRNIADMQRRISAARKICNKNGVDTYINARVDGYLLGNNGHKVFEDTILRGNAWLEAGADCVFVPGLNDIKIITALKKAIQGPVSVLVINEDTPTLNELKSAEICRISTGPRTLQFVTGALRQAMNDVQTSKKFGFMKGVPSFADIEKFS